MRLSVAPVLPDDRRRNPNVPNHFCVRVVRSYVLSSDASASAAEHALDSADNESKRTTLIHVNRPAQAIAKSLTEVMSQSNLNIATDMESNVVMLTGSQREVENAADILRTLDQAPQMINIEVVIVVRNTATGKDEIQDELQLSTLNDMQAQLQFGQQVTVPEAVQRVTSRTMARSYRRENVGTLVQATPRIVGNGIVLALTVEKSWVENPKTAESDSETDNLALPASYSTEAETTLHLQRGQSQTFRAVVSRGRNDGRDVLITVTATTAGQMPAVSRRQTGSTTSERGQGGGAAFRESRGTRSTGAAGRSSRMEGGQREGFSGRGILRPGDRSGARGGSRGGFGSNRGGFGTSGGRRDESPTPTRGETARPPATSGSPNAASRNGGEDAAADAEETKRLETQGRRYFHVLDRDTSGRLDREEWEASRRLKPMFEQAGITVTSMSEEEFVEQFVAATRHSKQQRKDSEQ